MINPSANGWIEKFFIEQKPALLPVIQDADLFYSKVRDTGFIYGHIISFETLIPIETKGWLRDEITKVALLNTLFDVYGLTTKDTSVEKFIVSAIAFYNEMQPEKFSILKRLLPSNSLSLSLENIIDDRVQTNIDIISKNFSNILTNALLFVDVLAFRQFLINQFIPENYLKKLEETIVNLVSLALQTKSKKSKYDALLIKLFESSVRFSKFSKISIKDFDALSLGYFTHDLEKKYLLDIAGLAIWSDEIVEKRESKFLSNLALNMNIPLSFVEESMDKTFMFIRQYKNDIPYFNYSNPVKHFYDQTTKNVEVLLHRNKNRLLKEISQSKELMVLLATSTHRDLDELERKKVRKQLLDVCKSIPSLTIFLLPGGSILLPILIKFIPKLLPSSFNENLDIE